MGFPDAANSVASISGALIANFLQQNLINQSFCGPSATFVEIAVLQWLRETVGYNTYPISNIWDVGGVVTSGGTLSNALAMMLARESHGEDVMNRGISPGSRFRIVIPEGIGHYSVRAAQRWLGCGNQLLQVKTSGYKYDLKSLEQTLKAHKGQIMAVVAYAGDSRTMTVEKFEAVHDLVREIDPSIWLHADACHGFSLGFSPILKERIGGIEKFDSVTTDPHKVMLTPYVVSTLLVREPQKMQLITTTSDLIMSEDFAFGQITPFLGSRSWNSLKLWFMMKNFGKSGLAELIERRCALAKYLHGRLKQDSDFVTLNEPEINAVAFIYNDNGAIATVAEMNAISRAVHKRILQEGRYHLHQFSIPDDGIICPGAVIYPLRFMSGNPLTTESEVDEMIEYVRSLCRQESEKQSRQAINVQLSAGVSDSITSSQGDNLNANEYNPLIASLLRQIDAAIGSKTPYFVCVYGSMAYGAQSRSSDIDVFVAVPKVTNKLANAIGKTIRAFHKANGLTIDNEVPFRNKLCVSLDDLRAAVNLSGLQLSAQGAIEIPFVQKSKEFLGSTQIRYRLLFNALTTPHVTGGTLVAEGFANTAEQNLSLLSYDLCTSRALLPSFENRMTVLLADKDGATGEDYLGYKNYPKVIENLASILRAQELPIDSVAELLSSLKMTIK
jgi:L-2,4-diaminobutyrate decarboxylase